MPRSCLVYQPIFSSNELKPVTVEALIRPTYDAQTDDGGLFKFVLLQTLSDYPELKKGLNNPNLTLQVNITANDLASDSFCETLLSCLQKNEVPAKSLILELTEHFAIEDLEKVRKNMAQCAALGVQIYLDDFGCGYSNLDWLLHLPVSGLKFDRAMVATYRSPKTSAIFRHLCALAAELGWKTTAEGVENLEDIPALRKLRFTCFQGYGLCRPAPLGEWEMFNNAANLDAASVNIISQYN